jgi:16S rRNA (guanine527-N7)-methyltransferase
VAQDTRQRLRRRLKRVFLDVPPDVLEGLVVYYEVLRRWNEKINLTALVDGDEAIDRLLVEPALAARHLPDTVALVVDIGSGGGSPAIPLKLSAPVATLWMVESKVRKAAFLREVVRQLGLGGVRVETCRLDELVDSAELYGRADVVSVRAVRADLKALSSMQQLLRPGGEVYFFTKRGASASLLLPPQLALVGEDPLVPALQSSLVRLAKLDQPTRSGALL